MGHRGRLRINARIRRALPTRPPRPGAGHQQPPRGRVRPRRATRSTVGRAIRSGPRPYPGRAQSVIQLVATGWAADLAGQQRKLTGPSGTDRDVEAAELVGLHRRGSTSVAQFDDGGLRLARLAPRDTWRRTSPSRAQGHGLQSSAAGPSVRRIGHSQEARRRSSSRRRAQPARHQRNAARSSTLRWRARLLAPGPSRAPTSWSLLKVASRAASAASGHSRWTAAPAMRDALATASSSGFMRHSPWSCPRPRDDPENGAGEAQLGHRAGRDSGRGRGRCCRSASRRPRSAPHSSEAGRPRARGAKPCSPVPRLRKHSTAQRPVRACARSSVISSARSPHVGSVNCSAEVQPSRCRIKRRHSRRAFVASHTPSRSGALMKSRFSASLIQVVRLISAASA